MSLAAKLGSPTLVTMACVVALLDVKSTSAVAATVPCIPRRWKWAVLAVAANAAREVTCVNAVLDVMGTRTVRTTVSYVVIALAKATPNTVALRLIPPISREVNLES